MTTLHYKMTPRVEGGTIFLDEEEWTEGQRYSLDDVATKRAAVIVRTRDKGVWRGLVALGWTPPAGQVEPE